MNNYNKNRNSNPDISPNAMNIELNEEDIPNSVRSYAKTQSEPVENTEKVEELAKDEVGSDSVLDKAIDYERKLFNARSLKNGRRAGKH